MDKKGQMWETLIPWIIAVAVLVIIVVLAFLLKGKLFNIGDYIRGIFR